MHSLTESDTIRSIFRKSIRTGVVALYLTETHTSAYKRKVESKMGVFEFLMLCCFGFSWPFSIAKSLRSRSAKGKSLGFMLLVEMGYVFGIIHKILYSFNWVIWAYVTLFLLVAFDIILYFRNSALDRKRGAGELA